MKLELKLAILAAGKTQRQVAAECSPPLSENKLSEIVRGWTEPREDEKLALARVLNKPVVILFEQGDSQPSSLGQIATHAEAR